MGVHAVELSPSAHVDTFCRDYLPPPEQWPELLVRPPGAALPGPAQLRRRAARRRVAGTAPTAAACCAGRRDLDATASCSRRANQIAHVLVEDLGLVPGNRVLLRGPNNPWLVACWLGRAEGRRRRRHHDAAAARRASCAPIGGVTRARAGAVRRTGSSTTCAAPACPGLRIVDATAAAAPTTCAAGRPAKPATFAAVATAADDVALLGRHLGHHRRARRSPCTSTATCSPIADTFARHVLRPRPDDVFTGTPPLAFTFGLGGLLVFPLRAGACDAADRDGRRRTQLAEAVAEHGVTVLFTAPTALPGDARGRRERPLRGAAPLRLGRRARCRRRSGRRSTTRTGLRIIDGIGSTEMLHIFISAADDDIRPGATGRAGPRLPGRGPRRRRQPGAGRRARPARGAAARPAAATSPTRGSGRTCSTAGTSPATPTVRDDDGYFWYWPAATT